MKHYRNKNSSFNPIKCFIIFLVICKDIGKMKNLGLFGIISLAYIIIVFIME